MSAKPMAPASVSNSFQRVCNPTLPSVQAKSASPFSIRLTAEERAYLDQQAGSRPLGAYIREKLLGDHAEKRRVLRKPKLDEAQFASLLAALGESRISSNLNQLAKHANMGTMEFTLDVEQELRDACGAVLAMRDVLMVALGYRPGNTKARVQ